MKRPLAYLAALALLLAAASAWAQFVNPCVTYVLYQLDGQIINPCPPNGTPTPTPPVPDGVATPQTGVWQIQTNDNFNTDSGINTGLWNGGPGAPSPTDYYPFCYPSGIPQADCNTVSGESSYQNCMAYMGLDSGGQQCGQVYVASNNLSSETISSGVGLKSLPYNNYAGGGTYFNSQTAELQNYGIVSIKPGSFVEYKAQLPADTSGAADGEHTDMWCTANSRATFPGTDVSGQDELDIAEHVMGTSATNHETQLASIFDGAAGGLEESYVYSAAGTPDLTAGMHTYGLYWLRGGGSSGEVQYYVDGAAVFGSPIQLNDPAWLNGVYCFVGWIGPSFTFSGINGNVTDSSTQDPGPTFTTQYYRYWTEPTPTPTPTPSPTPTPGPGPNFVGRTQNNNAASCTGSATSVTISPDGSVANGNYLIVFGETFTGGGFGDISAPAGWTQVLTNTNSNDDTLHAWYHVYESTDTLPYSFSGTNICAPKVILRDYSGVTGIDAQAGAASSGAGTTCTIPALTATAQNNEVYTGMFAGDATSLTWGSISGWGNATPDATQWSTYDGDFSIAASGTTPAAQTGTLSGSANNNCVGLTLE